MRWIKEQDKLPKIDTSDRFNKENKISVSVLVYSPTYGYSFGQYFYRTGRWIVQGIHSSNGIPITHWANVTKPKL